MARPGNGLPAGWYGRLDAMQYGLLGPLEVRDGSRTISLPRGRQRVLLAVLLLHANETLSSDRLIDAMWGEAPPPTAAQSLHNLVSGLRKGLGNGQLVTHGHGYALRVLEGELDVQRFDGLVRRGHSALVEGDPDRAAALLGEALGLWRGPPLADLAYEPAVTDHVERLEERRLAALEERIDAELARGRDAEVLPEIDALIADHPLRERLRGQKMVALYRAGRQADALAAYRQARRALVAELGIEPGPALRRLERAVLEQDPDLGTPTVLRSPPRMATAIMAPARRRRWAVTVATVVARVRRHRRAVAATAAGLAITGLALLLQTGGPGPRPPGAAAIAGDSLAAIDPASNRVVDKLPVGGTPTEVAVGAGAAWTLSADEQTVSRVDLRTKVVKTFSTGAVPIDLAADGAAVWVVQGDRQGAKRASYDTVSTPASVARLDPLSGAGRGTTPLAVPAGATFRVPPGGLIAAASGAVWVVGRPGWVHRVDGDGVRTQRSLDAFGIATGDGQVWIRDRRDRAVRLDPDTGRAMAHVKLPAGELSAIAVGAGAVWLTDPVGGTVWRVDPRRLDARTIAVQPGVDGVAVGAGAVWVTNRAHGTVTRIDPASERVAATISLGSSARAVAVGGGRVWVAVAGRGSAALPATGGLREGARVEALTAPPCGPVLTGRDGDPDFLVVSDLPLRAQLPLTLPMSEAVAFVLREHGFRAGRFSLGYQSCDDATDQYGIFDQAKCRDNARAYARNPAVLGVVGPLNSGCARAMLPTLNRAAGGPVALVSPANSDPGLLRADPAAPVSGEDRLRSGVRQLRELYPTGQRGYARVYPSDDYEVAAGAILAKRLGGGSVFYIEDRKWSASDPRQEWFMRSARRIGLRVEGAVAFRVEARSYRRLAVRVRSSAAGAVYVNTIMPANGGRLLRDLRAVLGPRAAIVGGPGFLPISSVFANAGDAARGVHVTSGGLTVDRLGATGRRFVRAFGPTQPKRRVSNFAVYAATATEVLLDAIARSDGTRESVARALARTRLADSPLGPLALDRRGEPVSNPISVVRAERGGGDPIDLSLDGSVTVDVITPPARLVVPGSSKRDAPP
jgi:DNA-binding SARP family transcriptional activator/ABC-type branched-subunit amino acid transport system substrate-binding protein